VPVSVSGQAANSIKLTMKTNISEAPHTGQKNVVIAKEMFSSNPVLRTKTLMGSDQTYSNARPVHLLWLPVDLLDRKADGYRLYKVIDEANNITSKFDFDTGGRDSHYEKSFYYTYAGQRLKRKFYGLDILFLLKSFWFGDYFAVNSYSGFNLSDIPSYNDSMSSNIFLGSAFTQMSWRG
jgi:hypothetical protein